MPPHARSARLSCVLLESRLTPAYTGGLSIAAGDLDADGYSDVVTAPTQGPAVVKAFSGLDGHLLFSFDAFPGFTGGANVAVGDVTGDGHPDIVVGAGLGGSPRISVFDGRDGSLLGTYFAYEPTFRGGVHVAVGDVVGDGRQRVVAGAGVGGGPRVMVFDDLAGTLRSSFMAYDPGFRDGVNVAAGNVAGDRRDRIITGAGFGGGPHVKVFDTPDGSVVRSSIMAFDESVRGGVNVSAADVEGDGRDEVVAGAGLGGGPQVKLFADAGGVLTPSDEFFGGASDSRRGVAPVGTRKRDGSPDAIITAPAGPAPEGTPSGITDVRMKELLDKWTRAGRELALDGLEKAQKQAGMNDDGTKILGTPIDSAQLVDGTGDMTQPKAIQLSRLMAATAFSVTPTATSGGQSQTYTFTANLPGDPVQLFAVEDGGAAVVLPPGAKPGTYTGTLTDSLALGTHTFRLSYTSSSSWYGGTGGPTATVRVSPDVRTLTVNPSRGTESQAQTYTFTAKLRLDSASHTVNVQEVDASGKATGQAIPLTLEPIALPTVVTAGDAVPLDRENVSGGGSATLTLSPGSHRFAVFVDGIPAQDPVATVTIDAKAYNPPSVYNQSDDPSTQYSVKNKVNYDKPSGLTATSGI